MCNHCATARKSVWLCKRGGYTEHKRKIPLVQQFSFLSGSKLKTIKSSWYLKLSLVLIIGRTVRMKFISYNKKENFMKRRPKDSQIKKFSVWALEKPPTVSYKKDVNFPYTKSKFSNPINFNLRWLRLHYDFHEL